MPPEFAPDFIARMVALRPALRRHAMFLIGPRTQIGSPDDFVQDTYLTALRSADRFEDDNFAGWLMAILHGHVRNARRRAWVRSSVPLAELVGAADDDADGVEIPLAATQELKLDIDDVMTVLRTLSAADQEIIRLARVEEWSHEQIADRLGLPLGTVHARLSRATARLRAAYEADPTAATALAPVRRRAA
jgi:RNA polymerase sigma-70 factor (ECF subfamily)